MSAAERAAEHLRVAKELAWRIYSQLDAEELAWRMADKPANWGDVGTMGNLRERLQTTSDWLFQEGEYSE